MNNAELEEVICGLHRRIALTTAGTPLQDDLIKAVGALRIAVNRIAELEDELMFQLDTRREETAEIERLKAENLKLQKQNRDCGWNCKQCEYVDKDLQAEESEQRLMELDRRLYELRSFNAKMKGEQE